MRRVKHEVSPALNTGMNRPETATTAPVPSPVSGSVQEPEQAQAHMQPMAADQGEKGRQEGTARGTGALGEQARELSQFQEQEPGAEQERRRHSAIVRGIVMGGGAKGGEATG